MNRNTKFLAGSALALAVIGGGAGMALAGNTPDTPTASATLEAAPIAQNAPAAENDEGASDDDGTETPITGDAFAQAEKAALAQFPDGTVTETEVGDEEGYYEVEVTLPDGRQVDVHLDENFQPLGNEHDGPDDERDE